MVTIYNYTYMQDDQKNQPNLIGVVLKIIV